MNLIQILEQEEIARVSEGKTIPAFAPGDTVVVQVKVKDNLSSARLEALHSLFRRARTLKAAYTDIQNIGAGVWA